MIKFVIFAMLIAFSGATSFSTCTSKPPPNAVRVTGCTSPPCKVVKGSTVTIEVDFTVPTSTTSLTASIVYSILTLSVPYSLPGDLGNVCAHLSNGATCPLAAQQSATYSTSFTTEASYPTIQGTIQLTIKNQSNVVVACFSIQVSIVDP